MLERKKKQSYKKTESKEAELTDLRTQLLNHEEELSKLKHYLEVEHRLNIEKPVNM